MFFTFRSCHWLSLTDVSEVGCHASAPVREHGSDEPQEWQEDAEDAEDAEDVVALPEGHEAKGEDQNEVQDSDASADQHCVPDMSYRFS